MPPRLTKGPKVSVAHPNPAIPAIEEAIPPVAKLVKTRPDNGAGVSSCNTAQTNGVNIAVLPPMRAITAPAAQGDSRNSSAPTANPPIANAPEMRCKRRVRFA